MPIQTARQAKEVFRKPSKRHPARHAQALRTSGPGIVHREMMDLQRQPDLSKSETGRLKELRRDWNRNRKYTDAGMALSGATSRLDAQDKFMEKTEDFRQLNPKAYGRMYPISGGIMHLGEQGGFLGAILSEIGKMGKDKGIPTVVDDSVEDQKKYITETFGPHRKDIEELDFTDEYEGPWPHEDMAPFPDIYRGRTPHKGLPPLDVYEGRRPHEGMPLLPREAGQPPLGAVDVTGDPTRKRDVGYDITRSNLPVEPMPTPDYMDPGYFDWVGKYYDEYTKEGIPKRPPHVIPGRGTSYVDEFADIVEEEEVPAPLSPYQGREFGLGQFMDTMPRDWQEYLEDVGRLGDMPGGHLDYEEWRDIIRRKR